MGDTLENVSPRQSRLVQGMGYPRGVSSAPVACLERSLPCLGEGRFLGLPKQLS